MSAFVVGAKLTRRIARETEQDVVWAYGHGDYVFYFVTSDHRHGWWNKPSGDWDWQKDVVHHSHCEELFAEADSSDVP